MNVRLEGGTHTLEVHSLNYSGGPAVSTTCGPIDGVKEGTLKIRHCCLCAAQHLEPAAGSRGERCCVLRGWSELRGLFTSMSTLQPCPPRAHSIPSFMTGRSSWQGIPLSPVFPRLRNLSEKVILGSFSPRVASLHPWPPGWWDPL